MTARRQRKRCVVLGGGGHAKMLIDALQSEKHVELDSILDEDPQKWGGELMGIPILGDDGLLPERVKRGVDCFVVGLGGVGNNQPRQRLFAHACSLGLEPLTVIHPKALCSRWTTIGAGSQLLPGSIVNVGARVGVNNIVNSGSIVEHDCELGDHVHIATGARLASTVRVGAGAHVGAGAVVRECCTIGDGAIVGAGSVVVKDVPPHTVVIGVPARPIRE